MKRWRSGRPPPPSSRRSSRRRRRKVDTPCGEPGNEYPTPSGSPAARRHRKPSAPSAASSGRTASAASSAQRPVPRSTTGTRPIRQVPAARSTIAWPPASRSGLTVPATSQRSRASGFDHSARACRQPVNRLDQPLLADGGAEQLRDDDAHVTAEFEDCAGPIGSATAASNPACSIGSRPPCRGSSHESASLLTSTDPAHGQWHPQSRRSARGPTTYHRNRHDLREGVDPGPCRLVLAGEALDIRLVISGAALSPQIVLRLDHLADVSPPVLAHRERVGFQSRRSATLCAWAGGASATMIRKSTTRSPRVEDEGHSFAEATVLRCPGASSMPCGPRMGAIEAHSPGCERRSQGVLRFALR